MGLFKKKKRVLVLGGGSARGLCNIGVLRVFENHFGKNNLPFDMLIGTSIGSLIGAAYCLGMSPDELEKKTEGVTWPKLVDIGLYPTGLIKGDRLEDIIRDCVNNGKFPEMKIPFALTTTDLETGEEHIHDTGDLVRLIRASCSWPGIFSAVEIDGRLLVDGGVRNSVPTKWAYKAGATFVVAVNPGFAVMKGKITNLLQATMQAMQIMGEELNTYQAETSDVAIKPRLENIDQFGFDKADVIIRQGELAAEEKIEEIKSKMNRSWWK
jgi:NTE family protein